MNIYKDTFALNVTLCFFNIQKMSITRQSAPGTVMRLVDMFVRLIIIRFRLAAAAAATAVAAGPTLKDIKFYEFMVRLCPVKRLDPNTHTHSWKIRKGEER